MGADLSHIRRVNILKINELNFEKNVFYFFFKFKQKKQA
jgi:hypothetical protein